MGAMSRVRTEVLRYPLQFAAGVEVCEQAFMETAHEHDVRVHTRIDRGLSAYEKMDHSTPEREFRSE